MINLIAAILVIFSVTAHAQLTNLQKAELLFKNLAINPGGEQSTRGYSVSGGSLASSTSPVHSGAGSISWNASAGSQTLSTTLVSIPTGDGACLAEFYYNGFGTADIRLFVKDNSANVIGGYTSADTSFAITSAASAWTKAQIPFACPSSATVQLVLEAQGDAATGYIDSFYLGRDYRVGILADLEVVAVGSRASSDQAVASTAATTIVFNSESVDLFSEFDTGTGIYTAKRAGTYLASAFVYTTANTSDERMTIGVQKNGSGQVCSGVGSASLTTIPVQVNNCYVTLAVGDTIRFYIDSVSDAAYNVDSIASNSQFIIAKVPDVNQSVIRGDTSDLSGWLSYAGTTNCQWSTNSASMAAFAADTDCPTQTVVGNVTAPGTKIPGMVVTNLLPGKYLIEARGSFLAQQSTVGNASCSYEIFDGTNSGTGAVLGDLVSAGRNYGNIIQGTFNYSSKQSSVTFQVRGKLITGNGTCDIVANAANADFEMRIIPLSQSLPRPFIASSVFAGRSSVIKIGAAEVNCDGSSSLVSNADSMVSTVGNISSGTCSITLTTGYFSSTPVCVGSWNNTGSLQSILTRATSATALTMYSASVSAGSVINSSAYDANIICIGNN